ncbi:MAG TPA: hypothetical protein VF503_09410 [Sphingobium sp.]|uniref:hypothetical protein n=1 Tax=Sphingobium sp. TaxID=1912891 RepID=UPI002ED6820D
MKTISEYSGRLLNHIETLYRPGDRDIAVELVEVLGYGLTDTGFASDNGSTFLAAHPNLDDRDVQNNVFYMSEITVEHLELEARLERLSQTDAELQSSLEKYRDKARSRPFGIPHFAIRYTSAESVEAVSARLETASLRLRDRVNLRIFRPQDADRAVGNLVQGFLYQDIIVSGSFLMGQLIELQTQP